METTARLLLIEDDPDQQTMFRHILVLAGYQVVTVATAEEALATLRTDTMHLLLSDRYLPGMQGDDLIRRIKHDYPTIKAILMSNQKISLAAFRASGADAWHDKHADIHQLRSLVARLLTEVHLPEGP